MNKKYAFILFICIIVIWGANWTVTKLIVQSIPPIWSACMRSLIAAVALFLLQGVTKQCIVPKRQDLPAIIMLGVFQMTIFATLMSIGLQYTSVGRSVILGYTIPLWVTPAAIFILKEPVDKLRLFGVFLGVIGVGIIFSPAITSLQADSNLLGSAALLAASFSWAISIMGIKMVTWHSTPFQLAPWQALVATMLTGTLAFSLEGIPTITWTSDLVWLLAYTGLLATAFGFWAITVMNRYLSAITMSLALLATPIFGMSFSLWVLGESMDAQLLIASAFILVGIGLGCIKRS